MPQLPTVGPRAIRYVEGGLVEEVSLEELALPRSEERGEFLHVHAEQGVEVWLRSAHPMSFAVPMATLEVGAQANSPPWIEAFQEPAVNGQDVPASSDDFFDDLLVGRTPPDLPTDHLRQDAMAPEEQLAPGLLVMDQATIRESPIGLSLCHVVAAIDAGQQDFPL